ncbi:MAG: nucleotidyltransferase domain-containing protein [Geobacteraceae bacterium]
MGVGADRHILERCKEAIRQVDNTAEIILFGSRARGDAEPDSDYDILVLTDAESSLKQERFLVSALLPLEIETGVVISFVLKQKLIWNSPLYRGVPLHENISLEGIPL